ncbi:hypothetical protein TREES_T100014644 [Tupaia chinensis]|uniref:Uncharacterized protein n=1 Tax=Tupaia chinensis TaxID=246437 RepID=L9KXF9_TUPCH|nr:hypothetical protein TREES_T100014644 [Tupaia chinensis]
MPLPVRDYGFPPERHRPRHSTCQRPAQWARRALAVETTDLSSDCGRGRGRSMARALNGHVLAAVRLPPSSRGKGSSPSCISTKVEERFLRPGAEGTQTGQRSAPLRERHLSLGSRGAELPEKAPLRRRPEGSSPVSVGGGPHQAYRPGQLKR